MYICTAHSGLDRLGSLDHTHAIISHWGKDNYSLSHLAISSPVVLDSPLYLGHHVVNIQSRVADFLSPDQYV